MFEKLKNIKLFQKKKGKEKAKEQSLLDDVFSPSAEDSFFSEPSVAEETEGKNLQEGEAASEFSLSSDDSNTETLENISEGLGSDLGSDLGAGLSDNIGEDIPEDKGFKEESKPPTFKVKRSNRRTFLMFILFLTLATYAAYTYVIPENYPALKKDIDSKVEELNIPKYYLDFMDYVGPKVEAVKDQISGLISGGDDAPEKFAAPKRIAIPAPPKKPMPEPPAKTSKQKPEIKPAVKKEPIKKQLEKDIQKPKVEVKVISKQVSPAKTQAISKVEPKKVLKKDLKAVRTYLPVSGKGYYIQAGAFIFKDNLKVPKRKIESLGFKPVVKTGSKPISMYRLLVGEWGDFLLADDIAAKLRRKGFKAKLTSKNEEFCVLIGSYYYKDKANKKRKSLEAKGFSARMERKQVKMKLHHLLLGPYPTLEKAGEVSEVLDANGLKTAIIQAK